MLTSMAKTDNATTIDSTMLQLSVMLTDVDMYSESGVLLNANAITNASSSDISVSPTVSKRILRRSCALGAPNTLCVFIAFMRVGIRAKKKFTKLINVIINIRTAMAMSV